MQISKNKNISSKLIALKETNPFIFKKEFNLLNKGDIFIDSMDPNDININFKKDHKWFSLMSFLNQIRQTL